MSKPSYRWLVVLASCFGLMVGSGSISTFGYGIFIKSMSQELGMSRATLSLEITLSSLIFAIGAPFGGRIVDRVGVRRFLLAATFLYAMSVAAFSLLSSSILLLVALSLCSGLAGIGQTPLGYSKIVSEWFDAKRGLALGLATAGVGLGTAIVPQYAGYLLQTFGWREAFVGLGIAVIVVAFIPVLLIVRPPTDAVKVAPGPSRLYSDPRALEEGKLDRRVLILAVAFFLQSLPINGTITHLVPLLTDRGLTMQTATSILGGVGIAIVLARIVAGACLDRFHGPYIGVAFILLPICGLLTLVLVPSPGASLVGAALCGLGIGAEVDVLAYLVSRYYGMRRYGFIYGVVFGAFLLGTSIGPFISGWWFDHFHSYDVVLLFYVAPLLVAAMLMLALGPYTYPAGSDSQASDPKVVVMGGSLR